MLRFFTIALMAFFSQFACAEEIPDLVIQNLPGGFGQGQCVERFGLSLDPLDVGAELELGLAFKNKNGKVVYSEVVTTDINTSGPAGGYTEEHVSSESLCEEVTAVVITKAIVTLESGRHDLLKANKVLTSKFVPLQIFVRK